MLLQTLWTVNSGEITEFIFVVMKIQNDEVNGLHKCFAIATYFFSD